MWVEGMVEMLPYRKRPKRLPTLLGVEEVAQFLEAARPGRERVVMQTAYACRLQMPPLLQAATAFQSSLSPLYEKD